MRVSNRWAMVVMILLCSLATAQATAASAGQALAIVAEFTACLQQGRFEEAHAAFEPEVQKLLPGEQLAAVWVSLPAQLGELLAVEDPYVVDETQLVIRQPAVFTSGAIDLLFRLNREMLIVEFLLVPHVEKEALLGMSDGPPYADQTLFTETELVFGVPEYPLEGTLTVPHGEGPFPAVVLVHGSGPNDRDETIGPNKPFRDLAWGLASRGIAVFRYDKRTLVHGQKMSLPEITVENEVITDAVLALELVAAQEEVDADRLFVLGHSLGGSLLGPIVQKAPTLAGGISMAGAARPVHDLMLEQVIYLAGLEGEPSAQSQAQIEAVRADVERIRRDAIPEGTVVLGGTAAYWRFFRDFAPAKKAADLDLPLLFLQGGRDYQVTETDWRIWRQELSDRRLVEFRYYDDLNHLFQTGEGPSHPGEYSQLGHVDVGVVEDIAAWIKQAI